MIQRKSSKVGRYFSTWSHTPSLPGQNLIRIDQFLVVSIFVGVQKTKVFGSLRVYISNQTW